MRVTTLACPIVFSNMPKSLRLSARSSWSRCSLMISIAFMDRLSLDSDAAQKRSEQTHKKGQRRRAVPSLPKSITYICIIDSTDARTRARTHAPATLFRQSTMADSISDLASLYWWRFLNKFANIMLMRMMCSSFATGSVAERTCFAYTRTERSK